MSASVVLNFNQNPVTLDFVPDRIIAVGAIGPAGPENTLTIGTVTTVAAGGSATASVGGTAPAQTLSLGIPRGATGATGPANTLTIGTVTTVAAGGSATASVGGTAPNQTVSFGIPTGATGATGAQGSWSQAQPTRTWSSGTTLTNGDAGYLIRLDNNTTVTVGTALALTAGQRIDFIQTGGTVASPSFTATGVTISGTPTTKIRTQYSAVTLLCVGSNDYVVVGDLAAS
jgi:hypothetical protein